MPAMDIIAAFEDRDIAAVVDPTVAAFAPLLKAKKNFIKEVAKATFKYGEMDRHQLDVYYPPSPPPMGLEGQGKKMPVMFFIYGGGFNTGDRSISPRTFGLVYACVAAFFARRGYVVVIPDYRLVPHTVFPGSAEDVRDAVRWVVAHTSDWVAAAPPSLDLDPDLESLVFLGHSAGAAHIATMLFHPGVLPLDDPLRMRIRAAVLESPPYDLGAMTDAWPTASVHATYWGTLKDAKANDPLHLYRRLAPSAVARLPALLMVEGEREPDWLIDAGNLFSAEVREKTGNAPMRIIAKGHNHISLNWALSTGEGEEWAEEVVKWLEKLRN